jgi:SAM-dependent methyltransferase
MTDWSNWRAESLERWERIAPGWQATRAAFQRTAMPVSEWMIKAIRPRPGHRVLELTAGLADTGLLAAQRVLPGGSVIITDGAEAMVEAARENAAERGVENVELRTMQAEWIDLPAASVDGVLSRFGYMLLADPEAALRETRRVLRPGGRVALAVWGPLEDNPWTHVMREALGAAGLAPPAAPDEPGPFALSAPGVVEELLETAGFDDVEIEALDLEFEAPSLDAWWDYTTRTSPTLADVTRDLAPADHYRLRDAVDAGYAAYVRDDRSLRLPARALVAAATA